MELIHLLRATVEGGGSDMFIIPGSEPAMKRRGQIIPVASEKVFADTSEELVAEIYHMARDRSRQGLEANGDDDFSFFVPDLSRFRCNVYKQRGSLAANLRVVPFGLPDPDQLGLPKEVMEQVNYRSGMVLVTGPAGSGKSTTLACMIDRINNTRSGHVITVEDPIEYLHRHKKCLVSQREVPNDARSFARALRSALRQAPDVIMLGEMRDSETIQTAITAAETGHLLFSSLHTIGTSKTIDRIIDTFPANQQQQIRVQLSMVLRAVVSQRLIPTVDGHQVAVFEVMTINPAAQNMIRDGKTFQMDNVIYSGAMASNSGMLSMDNEIMRLYQSKRITRDTALLYAVNQEVMKKRLG